MPHSPCHGCIIKDLKKKGGICDECILRKLYYSSQRDAVSPYEQYLDDIKEDREKEYHEQPE